ncbi:MAG: hypothetical protein ACI4SO_07995 [Muribaculaceae bacterium]
MNSRNLQEANLETLTLEELRGLRAEYSENLKKMKKTINVESVKLDVWEQKCRTALGGVTKVRWRHMEDIVTGYPFVTEKERNMAIHACISSNDWANKEYYKRMRQKEDIFRQRKLLDEYVTRLRSEIKATEKLLTQIRSNIKKYGNKESDNQEGMVQEAPCP